jgi:hypothetical protein
MLEDAALLRPFPILHVAIQPRDASRPGYRILYLAATHQVALHEVRALVSDPDVSWNEISGKRKVLR